MPRHSTIHPQERHHPYAFAVSSFEVEDDPFTYPTQQLQVCCSNCGAAATIIGSQSFHPENIMMSMIRAGAVPSSPTISTEIKNLASIERSSAVTTAYIQRRQQRRWRNQLVAANTTATAISRTTGLPACTHCALTSPRTPEVLVLDNHFRF
ncbi:hypothetical protein ACA910_010269 [Epithemia clementina (nom. ined.)]